MIHISHKIFPEDIIAGIIGFVLVAIVVCGIVKWWKEDSDGKEDRGPE